MKSQVLSVLVLALVCACDKTSAATGDGANAASAAPAAAASEPGNPALIIPKEGPLNVLHVAVGSKDHTTLVAALKAADYVDALTNAGPFTVFAPTNAAFEKLPKGTVESLVKPEKQEDLRTILKNHVAVSVYQVKDFKDGQVLGVANGKSVTLHVKDGKVTVNDANIVASVPASNGIVHVVDTVIVPK
jgi:uncharacterized surface protein with fasciclin (FAS1) repeats